jgi:hypothetical protein
LVFTANPGAAPPPPQSVYLLNTGGSLLAWTAAPNQGLWLDVNPMSGASNTDSFQVRITDTQLPIGQYQDRITVGGNAGNAGVQVSIVYNVVAPLSYTLSGRIVDNAGAGLEGQKVALAGTESRSTLTGPKGEYSFPGLAPGDYNVTPVSHLYDFLPDSRTYAPLTSDYSNVDFEARIRQGNVVIRHDAGWNLISLPMNRSGVKVATLFEHATSAAFEYIPGTGYVEAEELEFGKGYWIKFSKKDSAVVSGVFDPSVEVTVGGEFGGWALIGTPSGPVPLPNIMQSPAASLLAVYGYDPSSGYVLPHEGVLRPGQGYFIKVSTDAVLKLISGVLARPWHASDW